MCFNFCFCFLFLMVLFFCSFLFWGSCVPLVVLLLLVFFLFFFFLSILLLLLLWFCVYHYLGLFVSFLIIFCCYGLHCWLSVKESAFNAEGSGLIPELERSPGEGSGNLLHYCCLENPINRRALWPTVHEVWWATVHLLLLMFLSVFVIYIWFCFSVYFLFLFFFFCLFVCFLHSTACTILVLWPEVGPEPLRWECSVQDVGSPENSQPQGILISMRYTRVFHLDTKTYLHPIGFRLQWLMPHVKELTTQKHSNSHQ